MGDMISLEKIVYAILLITNCIIVWQWAKNGILEVAIQQPPNIKAIASVFVGASTLIVAGYLERGGYVKLSLITEANMAKSALIFIGGPLCLFFLVRYVILPKGLLEYNKARISTCFWAQKNYRPGVKMEKSGNNLANFSRAQRALKFFEKAIDIQRLGVKRSSLTRSSKIDHDQIGWGELPIASCPNCGSSVRIPVSDGNGEGNCISCSSMLGFKIIGNNLHLTAFGAGNFREVTLRNKTNIATAYEEMAFLLRMMNRFDEAREALINAEITIDNILESNSSKEHLAIKSLILFRQGEVAQTMGELSKALSFYKKSLMIDKKIGDYKDTKLVNRLISEVSK